MIIYLFSLISPGVSVRMNAAINIVSLLYRISLFASFPFFIRLVDMILSMILDDSILFGHNMEVS